MASAEQIILPIPPPARSFVFINDSHPDDGKSKSKRKLVRAQAARGPHANTLNGSAKSDKNDHNTTNKHQQLKRNKRGNGTTTIPLSVVGLEDPSPSPEKDTKTPVKSYPVTVSIEDKGSGSEEEMNRNTQELPQHANAYTGVPASSQAIRNDNASNQPFSNGLVHTMPGRGWVAPFITHDEPNRPYIPLLLDHCNVSHISQPTSMLSNTS